MTTNILDCKKIKLSRIHFDAGNITPIENDINIPFEIKRVFYIYDIPGGVNRGAHAHKECHQFIIAASGSFKVKINDGKSSKIISLNRPYFGLYIPAGIWAAQINFSSGAVCLVLTSHYFNENDYIRDYKEFLQFKEIEND